MSYFLSLRASDWLSCRDCTAEWLCKLAGQTQSTVPAEQEPAGTHSMLLAGSVFRCREFLFGAFYACCQGDEASSAAKRVVDLPFDAVIQYFRPTMERGRSCEKEQNIVCRVGACLRSVIDRMLCTDDGGKH